MTTRTTTRKLCLLLAGVTLAAGCSQGGNGNDYTPPPVVEPAAFTNWSKQNVFAQPETAMPTETESLVFNFDGDSNPDAYADLLPAT